MPILPGHDRQGKTRPCVDGCGAHVTVLGNKLRCPTCCETHERTLRLARDKLRRERKKARDAVTEA